MEISIYLLVKSQHFEVIIAVILAHVSILFMCHDGVMFKESQICIITLSFELPLGAECRESLVIRTCTKYWMYICFTIYVVTGRVAYVYSFVIVTFWFCKLIWQLLKRRRSRHLQNKQKMTMIRHEFVKLELLLCS